MAISIDWIPTSITNLFNSSSLAIAIFNQPKIGGAITLSSKHTIDRWSATTPPGSRKYLVRRWIAAKTTVGETKERDNRQRTLRQNERERNGRAGMCVSSCRKTSRVMARLVNTRHPTVDWGVNLPSKYISMYRTHVRTSLNWRVTFGHTRMQPPIHWLRHSRLNWFPTNLEVLGTVPLFELFLFVFRLPPIPVSFFDFNSYSFSVTLSPWNSLSLGCLWFLPCNRVAMLRFPRNHH